MPRRGRSSASSLLSPPLLILLLPIIALAFLFFAVRPFISLTSHVLRPNTVKKSWDSVNIFLVLFAILCGFFARKNDDGLPPDETANASSASNKTNEGEEEQSTSQQWFRYPETKIFDTPHVWAPATGVTQLKRSSSSYPDLRQESLWETGDDRFHFRFFDDFEIDKYRSPRPRNEPEEPEIKVIPVDTFTLHSSPSQPLPPKSPPPPPPPPNPPPVVQHKRKRTYRTIRRKDDDTESTKTRSPPPPPPIPPPSPARVRSEQKYVKSERRKINFKKEIAMAWDSLYNQRKRKKKQIKTKNVLDEPVQSPAGQVRHTRPPPPPPPPPSVFHSLFRKGSKSKKVHSVSTPPPPPPQPPPPPVKSSRSSERKIPAPPPPPVKSSRSSERKSPAPPPPPEPSRRRSSSFSNAGRPPLPTRANTWDENVNGVRERSPVIPMPPPPPPFKMPEMRFVMPGGFVRVRSAQSSRRGSPELEDADANTESSDGTVNAMDGAGSVFCPSPDVNVKADTFIARLHDDWRLEKMNSWREKETMGLGLGLGPGP
ncbi:formin-like protein 20 [Alnus glutinosa]|uniref:formin-like protein 20 n=1 Tax=Alnus glutinosa TaxID=3517 RepID=UPI002D78D3A2|nr:formin-like protein 20 [Alnus glutinosa]